MNKRVILIILDSVGCGEMPDAALYGDEGANTISNTIKAVKRTPKLDNLCKMGFSLIDGVHGLPMPEDPTALYGKMAERSAGKDTTTGHWEIAGVVLERPFPTFSHGFPREFMEKFEKAVSRKTMVNRPMSGTEVIELYGKQHMESGNLIVYTSGDSVFQVAAHEDIIPIEELYEICETARGMLIGELAVGRVIARPFVGHEGSFTRTSRRRDFSLMPPKETMLDKLKAAGKAVIGIGKIGDIFAERGLTESLHVAGNPDCIEATLRCMKERQGGLIFANLVDTDSKYGHRNDPEGYLACLEQFDERLPDIICAMREGDILIITADHGCDPTTPSTDHTREYVPLLIYGGASGHIGTKESFSFVNDYVIDYLLR